MVSPDATDYTGHMSPEDSLGHLRAAGASLAAAAATDLAAPIRGCPGWTMARLTGHVGQVHQWAGEMVRTGATEQLDFRSLPQPPEGDAVIPWFTEGVERVATALEEAGLEVPVWNWGNAPKTSAFWFRRMAEETTVHRWDAEDAVGDAAPLDAALAVEGIDELLQVLGRRIKVVEPLAAEPATIHLHATDVEGEWLLTMSSDGVETTHGHAKGDVALRAPASDLLLFLWKRVAADRPGNEVFGDASVLDEWTQKVKL
jgi:uncharacterized protein (TIGR03083 family)